MLKENNQDSKLCKKVKCICGRKVIVKKINYDKKTFRCATCETLGMEESKRQFLQINANSQNTIYQ